MSFWGHFWWFWGQLLGFGARSQARSRLFGVGVWDPLEVCFWGRFWVFLRSILGVFEVIFGHFWPLFVSFLGQFWVFLVILVIFGLFCFTRPRLFGADVRFLRFWSFLTYFDHFWVLWQDQKRPLSHFLDPQKSHFPRRSRLQFSVNTKIQFWQKSTPSILDPPIELFIDPTSHSIFQNVKNCKIRKSPTAQNSKSQSKVALSKLCVKSEKWLFRCAHFLNVLCKKWHFLMFLCIRKTPFLDFSGTF